MDRERFRKAVERKTTVFEFKGEPIVGKEPTVQQLRQWRLSMQNKDGSLNPDRAIKGDEALLAIVLRDDDGNPMLTMEEAYEGLFDQHGVSDVNKLCTEVAVFVGIDPSELREIRDAAKNLKRTGASESSGSLQPVKDEP